MGFYSAPLPSYLQGADPNLQQSAELYAIKFCLAKAQAGHKAWSGEDLLLSDSQSSLFACMSLCAKAKAKNRGRILRAMVKSVNNTDGVNLGFLPGCVNPADVPSRLGGIYIEGDLSQLSVLQKQEVMFKCMYVLKYPECVCLQEEFMHGHVQWWSSKVCA